MENLVAAAGSRCLCHRGPSSLASFACLDAGPSARGGDCATSGHRQHAVNIGRRSSAAAFLMRSNVLRRCRVSSRGTQRIMALVVDPSGSAPKSVSEFVERMEKAWLISKQPRPVSCDSCKAGGHTECLWCKGTGFFILGDNMLCEVPSRNTTCLICLGEGSVPCKDCKGTGYIARWLHNPPSKNKGS